MTLIRNGFLIHVKGKIENGSLLLQNVETGASYAWELPLFSDPENSVLERSEREELSSGFSRSIANVRKGVLHVFRVNVIIGMPQNWALLDPAFVTDIAKAFVSTGNVAFLIFMIDGKFFLNGGSEVRSFRLPKARYMLEVPKWAEAGCSLDSRFFP